ncbi:hypothetical protein D3C80_1948430 [compost metagenome]
MALRHRDVDERTAGQTHFRSTGRIRAALAPFENAGRRQQLRAMTHGSNWLASLVERAHQVQDLFVQAQVFRRTTARDQ